MLAAGGLTPIEKVLALQKVPLFSRTSVDEMQQVAAVTSTVTMTSGASLFAESAPPALWMILSGESRSGRAPPRRSRSAARSGDIIGALEMLGGQPLGLAGASGGVGVALRIARDDLFECSASVRSCCGRSSRRCSAAPPARHSRPACSVPKPRSRPSSTPRKSASELQATGDRLPDTGFGLPGKHSPTCACRRYLLRIEDASLMLVRVSRTCSPSRSLA